MPSFWAKQWGFPDPLVDSVQWNKGWEHLLTSVKPNVRKHAIFSMATLPEKDREAFYNNHRDRTADLCRFQHDLTLQTTAIFAKQDFENAWLRSSTDDRQAHLLEGLVRACLDSSAEDGRLLCEELTLENMEKGNGRAFLTLLKIFMLRDASSVPNEPIFLPSAKWKFDKSSSASGHSEDIEEAAFASFRLTRSIFICQFLWNTLASFTHIPRQQTLRRNPKPSHRDRIGGALMRYTSALFGPDFAKEMKRDHASSLKERVMVCQHCTMSEDEFGKDFKFMVCAPCKNLQNRRIFYCSRVCQKADWKPRHKAICGKPLTLKDAERSATAEKRTEHKHLWEERDHVGPPFKDIPALIYQVHALNTSPEPDMIDYVLFPSAGDPLGFSIQDLMLKSYFRTERNDAVTTGDRETVATLGEYLAVVNPYAGRGLTREDIMKQLTREFDFDVNAAVLRLDEERARRPSKRPKFLEDYEEWFRGFGDLLQNPELATERGEFLSMMAKDLTAKVPFTK